MVWPVISTMSSFPSYHYIIKWLRVEREFWNCFMCGWLGGEFREFSQIETRAAASGGPLTMRRNCRCNRGRLASHFLAALQLRRHTCGFTYCLFGQVGKETRERERWDRQKIPHRNILNCHRLAYHWDSVKDGPRDPNNKRTKYFQSGEEAKEIPKEIKIEYLSRT